MRRMLLNLVGATCRKATLREHFVGLEWRSDMMTSTPGYYGIVYAYSVQGQFEDALDYYQKTLALEESHVYANANLVLALLQPGREEKTIQALDAALKIDPDCVEAHLSCASY